MITVSVVMLSYNRRNDVVEGIRTILEERDSEVEIILVDNASTDGTVEIVQQQFPEVGIIAVPENIGVAAYNLGFRRAQGKYIVILDDDSFPASKAILRMKEEFAGDPKLGVVAFEVKNYQEYLRQKEQNENPSLPEVAGSDSCRYLMAFNGCGVAIRKSIIDQVGGYPEEFFLYWNEQDLAIRILDAGYRIRSFVDIVAYHKYSPTNRDSRRGPFYYTRNLYWLIWKYYYPGKLVKDTLRMIFYTFYYSFEQRTAVYLQAAFSAILNRKRINRKPVKKEIIQRLRLTYKLAFIYYK